MCTHLIPSKLERLLCAHAVPLQQRTLQLEERIIVRKRHLHSTPKLISKGSVLSVDGSCHSRQLPACSAPHKHVIIAP